MSDLGRNDPCWCGSGRKYKRCHLGADAQVGTTAPARGRSAAPGRGRPTAEALAGRVRPGRVGEGRPVPGHVPAPDYADGGEPDEDRSPSILTDPEEVAAMRRACRAARQVLLDVAEHVAPGVTTDELDALAHERAVALGAYPSPLNYHGFPKSLCTSVNEVICHGIPDDRPLAEGDIVNCDVTVFLDGFHGDNSITLPVGEVDEASARLVRVAREAMVRGIAAVRPGGLVRDVGRAIETHVQAHGCSVAKAFVGHGVGRQFHCEPMVPHYYDPGATTVLQPGMTLTVEPMINAGTWRHALWEDGWTAVTADLSRSAQFEHTVMVTDDGVEVLTLLDHEPDPLAEHDAQRAAGPPS